MNHSLFRRPFWAHLVCMGVVLFLPLLCHAGVGSEGGGARSGRGLY